MAAKQAMTKTDLVSEIQGRMDEDTSKKQVRQVLELLADVAGEQVSKKGLFVIPGIARLRVYKTKAKPRRKGINPFTQEETWFKAKPAGKGVRIRAVKALKDALD